MRKQRAPNVAYTGTRDTLHCYVCDRTLPKRAFLVSSSTEVCIECRRSVHHTSITTLRHFTRWCPECEAYVPITDFWFSKARGFSPRCATHEAAAKAEERRRNEGVDGYRSRWMRELKRHVRCSSCGSTDRTNFVHLRPDEKAFQISGAENSRTIDEIKVELRKCEVWCDDCMHDYVHSEMYRLGLIRSTSSIDWDALYALVDAEVQPIASRRGVVQMELPF